MLETRAEFERTTRKVATIAALLAAITFIGAPGLAFAANPCEVTPTGGTVELPPEGCEYLSPEEVHTIIAGLPAGTTIVLAPIHRDFLCHEGGAGVPPAQCSVVVPPGSCEAPGGALGGTVDCTPSQAQFQLTGTGELAGFNRVLSIPLEMEVHAAPRTVGAPVQSFPTEMMSLQGEIFGDPDFDLLRIRAGGVHGMPSPGHTTLTLLPNGNFAVDSFFDITYEIEMVGAPGGPLAGMAGTTTGTLKMATGLSSAVPTVPKPGLGVVGLILLAVGAMFIPRLRRKMAST